MHLPKREFLLYVDDSGSRDPDKDRSADSGEVDWYGLGGLLLDASKKPEAEKLLSDFRARWPQLEGTPLRSYNIRNKTEGFRWLVNVPPAEAMKFYGDLSQAILSLPVYVHACVVDRPGYNRRYLRSYGPRRWRLCRTAFTILVERAAKFAFAHEGRLRVLIERSDKKTEAQFKSYFEEMRTCGTPFDSNRSAKYTPMTQAQLKQTLLEFATRTKASPLMQIADLVLWPVCDGGYRPDNRNLVELRDGGKLLDQHCPADSGLFGIKYSCFDKEEALTDADKQKPA